MLPRTAVSQFWTWLFYLSLLLFTSQGTDRKPRFQDPESSRNHTFHADNNEKAPEHHTNSRDSSVNGINWILEEPAERALLQANSSEIAVLTNSTISSLIAVNSSRTTVDVSSTHHAAISTTLVSSSSERSTLEASSATEKISSSSAQPSFSVTGSSFFTQESLPVNDSSVQVAPKIQVLLSSDDYSDIFDQHVLQSKGDFTGLSSWLAGQVHLTTEKNTKSYVEAVSKGKHPFLFTGKASARTRTNCYVVKIQDGLLEETRLKMFKVFETMGGTIKHKYAAMRLAGFSVCFPPESLPLALIKRMSGVVYVERDQYSAVNYVQEEAPWQLARLTNQNCDIEVETRYSFNATGKGVNVYVIDSGAMVDHPEFGGRAQIGFSVFPNFPNDCAGHGTQVSSVIAGTNVGVAKLANIIAAQVLDCDGQGENSAVLAALSWISANHQKPAVVNMSVGGPQSPSVDGAVRAMVEQGIGVVVAAGNSMINACDLSPSGVESAFVVGASTKDQLRADFSNFGPCVDVFAPGRHVVAAGVPAQATKNGFMLASGTSLSAPLVTGLYALLLESNPSLSPAQLKEAVIKASAKGLLQESTLFGSPNLLAGTSSLSSTSGASFDFLPGSAFPSFGNKVSSNSLEILFVYIALGLTALFLLVTIALITLRFVRKEKQRDIFQSSFQ